MSYTYPEALAAMDSIANDFMRLLNPNTHRRVRVICDVHAQTACVTWDMYSATITMPVRPATSQMLQTEFEDWVAYILHELGHPTFTDKATWEEAVRKRVSRMVNALEDVRMEKAIIASGIVPNAKAVLSRLLSRKIAEARAPDAQGNVWKPNARREFAWTVCVLGRTANGYAFPTSDLDWINAQIKPNSTVGALLVWVLPALAACNSTADCLALAEKINAVLAQAPSPGDDADVSKRKQGGQGQQGQQGQQGDKGEEGEGEGEGQQGQQGEEGEGEGEGEEGEQGEGEGEGEEDSPGENKPTGGPSQGDGAGKGGQGHGDGSTDDELPVESEGDLVERSLAPDGDAMPFDINSMAEKTVLDILRNGALHSVPNDTPTRRMGPAGIALKNATARASRQRALLARALRANETDDREGGRKAGRLDRGALSRAMAGAPNVFARREMTEGYDTDVSILLDGSGSMAGENMAMALETGLAIAQAAGSVGAACTTEVFNSGGYVRAGGLASKRVPNPAEFGALVNSAGGGTPLSVHMARAALSQAKRAPHKRRVLFVVTDGGCDYGPQTVKRMATYLEQACGTVLAHVSICTPLQGSFRAEVCVPHGTPLAQVGLEHFVKVLQAL